MVTCLVSMYFQKWKSELQTSQCKYREFLPKSVLYLWVAYERQISWLKESEFSCCSLTIVCNSNILLSQVSVVLLRELYNVLSFDVYHVG